MAKSCVINDKNAHSQMKPFSTCQLSSVVHSISKYFPDFENRQINAFVLSPFSVDKGIFPDTEIEVKHNSSETFDVGARFSMCVVGRNCTELLEPISIISITYITSLIK